MLLFGAQATPPATPPPSPPARDTGSPVLEVGGSHEEVWTDGSVRLGPWRAVHGSLAWQPPLRVRPRVELARQSRPAGGHMRATIGAHVDWTSSLYSYQAVTVAPPTAEQTRFYPARRADVRVFWKIPRHSAITLAAGYTTLSFGRPQRSHIVNLGTVIYGRGVIGQGTAYLNQNQPGSLRSAAGNVSVQFGAEGRGWYGVGISGGRELYRLGTLDTGGTADFTTATISVFARRWLVGTAGIHAAAEYQRMMGSYSRVGVTAQAFVGF